MESDYSPGELESIKFSHRKPAYYKGLNETLQLGYTSEDLLHYFPCFVGHMTLSRYLCLYEAYKMCSGVAGHIAELGVYKGAGTLLFAKLTQIFEPESLVQVHGFDWFRGTVASSEEPNVHDGSYAESKDRLLSLIEAQNLSSIVRIHDVDLTKELPAFFDKYPHLQFKLIFLDAGFHDVVYHSIEHFWQRLTPGGVLVLDQFNHELSPGETRAVKTLLPNAKIRTFPFGWLPSAYIVKE